VSARPLAYCARCDDVVPSSAPWSGWRWAYRAWIAVAALLLALSPFYAMDVCIMTPSVLGVLLAGGPLRRYALARPSCVVCSAELEPGRESGSSVRVRPFRREPPPASRVQRRAPQGNVRP
jgi:hypothetical protein